MPIVPQCLHKISLKPDFYPQLTYLPWQSSPVVPEIISISISMWKGCWDGLPPATGQLLLPAQLIGWQVAGTTQVFLSQEEEEWGHQVSLYPGSKMKRLLRHENKSCTHSHRRTHTPRNSASCNTYTCTSIKLNVLQHLLWAHWSNIF